MENRVGWKFLTVACTAVLGLLAFTLPAEAKPLCDDCAYLHFDGPELFVGAPGEAVTSAQIDGAGLAWRFEDMESVKRFWQGGTIDGLTVPGAPEVGDGFASSVALGDFNDDGAFDLAVGIPDEDIGSVVDAGAVIVLYGVPDQDTFGSAQVLYQGHGVPGAAEPGDQFGFSLTSYPTNNGPWNLVVGVPYEDLGTKADAGMVQVLLGSAAGLVGTQTLHQGSPGVAGAVEAGDEFGFSVVAINSSSQYMVVGVPGEDLGTIIDAGAAQDFATSSGNGVFAGSLSTYYQGSSAGSVAGAPEQGDRFGHVVAMRPTAGTLVAAPFEDIGFEADAGVVHLLYPLGESGNGVLRQGKSFGQLGSFAGVPEAGDLFGWALLAEDGGRYAIGAPGEDIGGAVDTGVVHVFGTGTSSGITTIHQNTTGIAGNNESGDLFGSALTVTNANDDSAADLVIGAPGEDAGAGRVTVVFGADATQEFTNASERFQQADGMVPGTHEPGDRFGATLLGQEPK